jgi:hypothetical protein
VFVHPLAFAVGRHHGCKARWFLSIPVREELPGRTIRRVSVEVFALHGHPTASCAYAWEEPADVEGGKPKVYTVLHEHSIRSAADAVRASLAERHEASRGVG